MADAKTSDKLRRGLVRAAIGGGVLILLVIAALAALSRPPLSNRLMAWALGTMGAPGEVEGAYLGFGSARIAAARLGPDLEVEGLEARYSLGALLSGHLKSVHAKAIKLVARATNQGIEVPLVGKLGAPGSKAAAKLDLPAAEIDLLDVSIAGLPVPCALRGAFKLAPETQEAGYAFSFIGDSDFGTALPGEIKGRFDAKGDASVETSFRRTAPPSPGTDIMPSGRAGLLIDHIEANANLVAGVLQSAGADIDVRAAHLGAADLGDTRLVLAMPSAQSGTLDVTVAAAQLGQKAASDLSARIAERLADLAKGPPLAGYRSDLNALAALPAGTANLAAHFDIARSADAPSAVSLAIESMAAKLAPASGGTPLAAAIAPAQDGKAQITLLLGAKPVMSAHFAVAISAPGPHLEAGTVDVSATGGSNAVAAADISSLALDWPNKTLKLALKADRISYRRAQNAVAITAGKVTADGTLAANVSVKALSADISGVLSRSASAWSAAPASGCYTLSYKSLSLQGVKLLNGGASACAQGAAPLAVISPGGAAPAQIQAKLALAPTLVDLGGADNRVRIALLTASAHGSLGALPAFDLSDVQGRIEDAAKSPRFAPVILAGALGARQGRMTGSLSASALNVKLVSANLNEDLASGVGTAAFDSGDISFTSKSVAIQKLVPALRGLVTSAAGKLRLSGKASWAKHRAPVSHGTVSFKDFGVTTTLGRIDGINGDIALGRLWPPRSNGTQVLKVKTMNVGLPLVDGVINFSLPEKPGLDIENAVWPWAGGALAIVDSTFTPGAPVQHVTMSASAIDLTQVFKLLSIDGLSGTGTVDGRLPIEIRGGDGYIVGGALKARAGGVLQYTGQAAAAAAAKGKEASLLFAALKDFHYTSLEIGVDGRLTGTVNVTIKLRGYNPSVQNGRPVELNISVESELANLVLQTTQGLRIGDEIRQALPGGQ